MSRPQPRCFRSSSFPSSPHRFSRRATSKRVRLKTSGRQGLLSSGPAQRRAESSGPFSSIFIHLCWRPPHESTSFPRDRRSILRTLRRPSALRRAALTSPASQVSLPPLRMDSHLGQRKGTHRGGADITCRAHSTPVQVIWGPWATEVGGFSDQSSGSIKLMSNPTYQMYQRSMSFCFNVVTTCDQLLWARAGMNLLF